MTEGTTGMCVGAVVVIVVVSVVVVLVWVRMRLGLKVDHAGDWDGNGVIRASPERERGAGCSGTVHRLLMYAGGRKRRPRMVVLVKSWFRRAQEHYWRREQAVQEQQQWLLSPAPMDCLPGTGMRGLLGRLACPQVRTGAPQER